MTYFPASAIIYIFCATTCLVYGIRAVSIVRKTNNDFSRLFAYLAFWAAFCFYLYSVPGFIKGLSAEISGMFYLAGSMAMFMGCNQSLRLVLKAWKMNKAENILKIVVPFASSMFFLVHYLAAPPLPYTDGAGLIHWNIDFPFNIITFIAGVTLTLIPGIFLFSTITDSRKAALKKSFFSVTFIVGGFGGWGLLLLQNTALLFASYIALFTGFVFLALVVLTDIFMKDDKAVNA